jgi:hypothetical protein
MRQTRSLFMWRAEICWDKEIGRRIKNQQYGRGLRFAPQLFHKFAKGVEGRFSAIATKGLRFSTGNRVICSSDRLGCRWQRADVVIGTANSLEETSKN